eukprot:372937-Prorocentrum_minimum.AAC.2
MGPPVPITARARSTPRRPFNVAPCRGWRGAGRSSRRPQKRRCSARARGPPPPLPPPSCSSSSCPPPCQAPASNGRCRRNLPPAPPPRCPPRTASAGRRAHGWRTPPAVPKPPGERKK